MNIQAIRIQITSRLKKSKNLIQRWRREHTNNPNIKSPVNIGAPIQHIHKNCRKNI